MANLSQQKRVKMLAFLDQLKKQHTDDSSLIALSQIEKELTSRKYGLVWEEHEENVDVSHLIKAISSLGYQVQGHKIEPYQKKGFFSFLKK